jgi:transposase
MNRWTLNGVVILAKKRVRRSWSAEEKRSICSQTLTPGVSVAQVARRYAMNANLIFKWLKDPRFQPDEQETEESVFLPVEIFTEPEATLPAVSQSMPVRDSYSRSVPRIEIATADGHRLTVEGGFDGTEVARLLKGLVS